MASNMELYLRALLGEDYERAVGCDECDDQLQLYDGVTHEHCRQTEKSRV